MSRGGNGAIATREQTVIEAEVMGEDVEDFRQNAGALEAITRAEIDKQIATAKRYPRSIQRFLTEARTMISNDPALAWGCRYRLPARRGGDGKPIVGPSVRLAEIAVYCFGNLRVAGRIIEDDGRFVTVQGVCADLEKNNAVSMEGRRSITTKDGRRFSPDMVATATNAAIAIVTRNAVFKIVPRFYIRQLEDLAEEVARGDVKSIPDRTKKAIEQFKGLGVKEADIFRTLEIAGPAEMTIDKLIELQQFWVAIRDHESTAEEIFAPKVEATVQQAPGESKTSAVTRAMAEKRGTKTLEPAPPAGQAADEDEPGADG